MAARLAVVDDAFYATARVQNWAAGVVTCRVLLHARMEILPHSGAEYPVMVFVSGNGVRTDSGVYS